MLADAPSVLAIQTVIARLVVGNRYTKTSVKRRMLLAGRGASLQRLRLLAEVTLKRGHLLGAQCLKIAH